MSTVQNFSDVFRDRIKKIEADAKECSLNLTSICQEAGMSRATPDRWKRSTPKTIKLVEIIEGIVAAKRSEMKAATAK